MKNIFVTQPDMPPLEEYVPLLREIWENKILTNGGPFHQHLERALAEYLGVEHVALVANATIGLVTALQALRVGGEVITTPYSFVATAHSLLWNGITPVFVDIDQHTLNIDPDQIEAAITPRTTAILAVHCYGCPCDVEAIKNIADKYRLQVIYDAAHAFGVADASGSVLRHGDLSVLSFHATKVFNTFEGGAIICPDGKMKLHVDRLKNFGFVDEVTVSETGINGKMSEVNAAFGLLQLKHVGRALARRAEIDRNYREQFTGVKGVKCLPLAPRVGGATKSNFSYFPILIGPDFPISRDALYNKLRENGVFSRRYFYPLISDFPMYRGFPSASRDRLPVAASAADRVLCLPIYPALAREDQQRVIDLVVGT